jgi:hypothetical protein
VPPNPPSYVVRGVRYPIIGSAAGSKLNEFLKDTLRALQPVQNKMSVIDKMILVRQRRDDLNKSLNERAQALLDRYDAVDKKADVAFGRHDSQLTAEENELAQVEAAIAQVSNLGNLRGSSEQ